ncbi:MAG: hypothetical protein J6J12_02000 [Oscillospiraceae bacterium]|nr:hypothetical protein [Oscillospiraceae bacterium]
MKKKVVTVLVVIVIVLVLGIGGMLGFVWYRDNHVFIEGDAYPLNAAQIDLLDRTDITFEYYHALQEALPDSEIRWNVPFAGGRMPSDIQNIHVNHLTQDDVDLLLTYFPKLKTLDATSGDYMMDYRLLEDLAQQKPEWEVLYEVDLEGIRVAPDVQHLELKPGEYTFDTLIRNLTYLRQLTQLKLRTPELTMEQLEELKAAFPELDLTCTAEIFGTEYDTDTTELDLSALTDSDVETVAPQLALLPNLNYVNLNGSGLSRENVRNLMQAVPGVVVDYSFEFFGETLSTADEEIKLANVKIGDENEAEVRLALDLLTNCKRFVLDNCHLSDEVLAKIRDDYRGRTKVVWRVWFGGGSSLTDAEVIRCTYDLVDDNCEDLYWCEDVRFVDFGHNEWLDGCDFIAGMKNLEYCILSGAPIKSLEPFANCKNLKFLEVAFCEYIESVEPLKNCTQLEKLNISNTHVTDLKPLDDLPLTHFVAMEINAGKSRVPVEEQERFLAQHPECWTQFEGKQPYDEGWRRAEDGKTSLPHYAAIQIAFRYPHAPNNVGWYLKDEERSGIEALNPMKTAVITEEAAPEETIPETIPAEDVSE